MNCRYLVIDTFPDATNSVFNDFYCGIAGVWIRHDLATTLEAARDIARQHLANEGWMWASLVLAEQVSAETYDHKCDGRVEFEQCIRDGVVIHVRRVEREVLSHSESEPAGARGTERYHSIVESLRTNPVVLVSEEDEQLAVGVSPNGQEFRPLWSSADSAKNWTEYWPGHVSRRLGGSELARMLRDAVQADGCIALGDEHSLVTTHAQHVLRDLLARGPNR